MFDTCTHTCPQHWTEARCDCCPSGVESASGECCVLDLVAGPFVPPVLDANGDCCGAGYVGALVYMYT